MALSVCVFVGDAIEFLPILKEKAAALKITAGHVEGADLGPVISPVSDHYLQNREN